MGISRQGYYKAIACERKRAQQDEQVVQLVRQKRQRQPRVGTRKLHYMLQEPLKRAGIKLGRDAMFGVLRAAGMLVARQRAYHKTTNSHHYYRCHPNLLKDGLSKVTPTASEQVWVADMTYLPTDSKMAYLSLVTDAYSRKIVGWHVHEGMQTSHVAQALKMALRNRQTDQKLVHHSDRGIQYCSAEYQRIHARHGVTCSMTDGYDCYQNALAERINGILKMEFLLHRPANARQARQMVRQSVEIYNQERPHLCLKYKTPQAIHSESVATQKRRTSGT